MNILITGGAGFIGSHLADALIKSKHTIFIIDDLSSGRLENIKNVRNSPYLHFYKGTILNESLVRKIIDKVDTIYHLAATVGVKLVLQNTIQTIENNVYGTEIILKYANKKRKKVLLASSSEVYGKSTKESFSEVDDLMIGPTNKARWSYAASKIIDEHLALAYANQMQLPVVIVRLFNTVGERQTGRYGMVIPRFIHQAVYNEAITIYGNGEQSRCFCYVGDVIDALIKLMDNSKADGQIYNVGSSEIITINELADKIINLTKSKSTKIFIPYDKAYGTGFEDIQRRMPDIRKLQRLIGFRQKYDLSSIILKMKDYLLHNKD